MKNAMKLGMASLILMGACSRGPEMAVSQGGQKMAMQPPAEAPVVINGVALNAAQIGQIQQQYGIRPKPGNYWYDPTSGLYGVRGHQAFGFMLPGHNFGPLPSNASAGDTGVFVNGRQLPQLEWVYWSQFLGGVIMPGRYWLDGNGNAGYEGNPYPTVNLYVAAQQNFGGRRGGGGGGGGDNFWTSRFSAGNHDDASGAGYVSVPGYGPVGYGF